MKDYKALYEEKVEQYLSEAEKLLSTFNQLKEHEFSLDSLISSHFSGASYIELGKNEMERRAALRISLPNEVAKLDMYKLAYETQKTKIENLKFYIEALRPLI